MIPAVLRNCCPTERKLTENSSSPDIIMHASAVRMPKCLKPKLSTSELLVPSLAPSSSLYHYPSPSSSDEEREGVFNDVPSYPYKSCPADMPHVGLHHDCAPHAHRLLVSAASTFSPSPLFIPSVLMNTTTPPSAIPNTDESTIQLCPNPFRLADAHQFHHIVIKSHHRTRPRATRPAPMPAWLTRADSTSTPSRPHHHARSSSSPYPMSTCGALTTVKMSAVMSHVNPWLARV